MNRCTWWTSSHGARAGRREGECRQAARWKGCLGDHCRRPAFAARGHPGQRRGIRGAIIKGKWKLVKIALFRARPSCSISMLIQARKITSRMQNPDVVRDLESRLIAYAKEQKMSEWLKAQPDYLGAQGKTVSIPISTSTMAAAAGEDGAAKEVERTRQGHENPTTQSSPRCAASHRAAGVCSDA